MKFIYKLERGENMRQWGAEFIVYGVTFIPLLKTVSFEIATPESIIEDVIIIHNAGRARNINKFLKYKKEAYVGQEYSAWLTGVKIMNLDEVGKDELPI